MLRKVGNEGIHDVGSLYGARVRSGLARAQAIDMPSTSALENGRSTADFAALSAFLGPRRAWRDERRVAVRRRERGKLFQALE